MSRAKSLSNSEAVCLLMLVRHESCIAMKLSAKKLRFGCSETLLGLI